MLKHFSREWDSGTVSHYCLWAGSLFNWQKISKCGAYLSGISDGLRKHTKAKSIRKVWIRPCWVGRGALITPLKVPLWSNQESPWFIGEYQNPCSIRLTKMNSGVFLTKLKSSTKSDRIWCLCFQFYWVQPSSFPQAQDRHPAILWFIRLLISQHKT